jgi:molybdopterin converting factor small subunit
MCAEPIAVRVSLFAALRRFAADGTDGVCDLRLPAGATVAHARAAVGIPDSAEITVGVNGAQANEDMTLQDGDRVVLFNALSGGDGRQVSGASGE